MSQRWSPRRLLVAVAVIAALVAPTSAAGANKPASVGNGASAGTVRPMVSDSAADLCAQVGSNAGFPHDNRLVTAVAVGLAESSCNPSATYVNPGGNGTDRGLWQINSKYHPEVTDACAYDAQCNADAAYRISSGGTSWTPWSTYNSGKYLQFMSQAQAAVDRLGTGSAGDPVGGVRAYQWGDQELVFERGSDGSLSHWYWIPDGGGTRSDTWTSGGTFVGHPTGFAWNDQEHVFARSANNTLMHWWWTASDMTVHFADWGGQVFSDPTAFVWNGQQHIFAKSSVGSLWHWYWDPGTATVSQVVWGQAPAGFVGDPFGFKFGDQQHVVACGPDHTLYHWWWSQDTGVVSFADWGGQCYDDPVAFVYEGVQQQIFAKSASGTLYHWWWTPQEGGLQNSWGGNVG